MNLTELPRRALGVPYTAAKLSLTPAGRMLEWLPDDDPRRLAADELRGRVQEFAGRLVGDGLEADRGRARRGKASKLREALAHERAALRRRADADAAFRERRGAAVDLDQRAERTADARRRDALAEREEARRRIADETAQRRQATLAQVDAKADTRRGTARGRAEAAERAVQATAADAERERQAGLDRAGKRRRGAAEARRRADTTGEFADREKTARRSR